MADPVTGALVGAAFGEGFTILHEAVRNVVGQAIMFKSILRDLESTLDRIAPQVQKIKELNLALDRPERETEILTEQMKKGAKLVRKCSKIQCWNYCFKSHYASKLSELNDAIETFCRVDLILQIAGTGLETLNKLNQNTSIALETSAKVDQNTNIAVETSAKVDQNTSIALETSAKVDQNTTIAVETSAKVDQNTSIALETSAKVDQNTTIAVETSAKVDQNTSIALETSAKVDQNTSIAVETSAKVDQNTSIALETSAKVDQNTSIALETSGKVDQNTSIALETSGKVDRVLERLDNSDVRMRFRSRTLSVPKPRDDIVGLDLPLKELKQLLSNKKEPLLLLTALGGCGKTTLVKMLFWDKDIKDIYGEKIFFVNVSQAPNLTGMVQKLFKHNGEECLEFQSDEEAIDQLEQLLDEIRQPILLILDDVWPGSESLIEKFMFNIPDYKIVVTSRTAFPRFPYRYKLNPLNRVDAMSLFCYSASLQDQDESSDIPEEYIEKFVSSCGGLPIALKVIGGSLRGQLADVWLSKLTKWSEGHSIFDSDADVLDCLQKSLEFSADKTLKEYFMDLGSFPEDQRISATALIDMWTELHEPSEKDVHAITNLLELHNRNLASLEMTRKDETQIDYYYNEDFITQHDVLRDLAIHLSNQEPVLQRKRLIVDIRGNNPPKWWTEQKQPLINARLLSISTDELFSSSWCNIQVPEVEALVLNFQTRNYALPEFVEKMVKLKVIVVTNYGFFPAELSNFQLLRSLPNLTRIRLEKVSIPSLCNTLVLLRSLKKLSLFMCNIGQAFGNSTIKVLDSLPNLMEINIDYCNDLVELPGWLCEVLPLKKLRISNCHKLPLLPERIGNLTNLEVLRLRSCTELSKLPDSIKSLHELSILDISDCLSICKLPKDIGELHSLTEFHMKECLRLRNQLPPSIMELQQLKRVVCDEERAKLWEPFKEFLSNLKVKVVKKDINLNWLPK